MRENVYQLGIIGLGGMGNWHREVIESVDGLEVCGSFDIQKDRQIFAESHSIHAYHSQAELLADSGCDIILVSTPNDFHKEIAVQAMLCGKHVVCEKPAALSSGELEEIFEAAKRYNRLFVVHQNRRWDEDYLTVKKVLEEGNLGKIHRIESRVHGARGIPGDWRKQKECGGGMVMDWGVHILDQLLQMIPEKVKTVYAMLTHVTNELVDDGFTAILGFESGLIALIEVGTNNFIGLPRWYILGQNGTAVIQDWDLSGEIVLVKDRNKKDAVPVRTAAGLTKTMAPRTEETVQTEALPVVKSDIHDFYQNIIGVLDGKESILVKNEEVMRVMKLMEAIFESYEKKTVVYFE